MQCKPVAEGLLIPVKPSAIFLWMMTHFKRFYQVISADAVI